MFERVTPEEIGISSINVRKYLEILEKYHLSTHSVIMIRHNKIFCEAYWKPFHKDFLHRMYSVSKSFVGIAIGFMIQDGLINLDDPISKYFDKSVTENASEHVQNQTIRQMLMMATGANKNSHSWFDARIDDRLQYYFDSNKDRDDDFSKIPGTIFDYDSNGDFVLGALIENLTGKTFMEYLREKFLDEIGFSKEATCLKCPGGHSWTDSAILCKTMDVAKTLIFLMNNGVWNNRQILNEEYVKEAVSNIIDTDETSALEPSSYGYGYQIWHLRDNCFFFNGMGCQFGIAVPDKDMVFMINSDNQGSNIAKHIIIDRFFEEIVDNTFDNAIEPDEENFNKLNNLIDSLNLFAFKGDLKQTVSDEINGKEFIMKKNPMGITKMKFEFSGDKGLLRYTNEQGGKVLHFGINKNVYSKFPQEGYSDLIGSVFEKGNYYDCAASAKWTHERSLSILVQIIDKYFGRLCIRVYFTDDDKISVSMFKTAEDFLNEYEGYGEGTLI